MVDFSEGSIEYIDQVKQYGIEVDLDEVIKKYEVVVPVVGGFSSGKSTFLNSLLKEDILPTNITPETAIATELRYGDNYIEAVGERTVDQYAVNEISQIDTKKYKFLRVYLHKKFLKNIDFVLVDLPGFNSPNDLHNQAILNYIEKGSLFIVLISAEEATITKKILRELQNLATLNKNLKFILSKVNLKSDDEVDEIKKLLLEDIEDYFGVNKLDSIGLDVNASILDDIDTDEIIKNIFLDKIKELYIEVQSLINIKINTLKEDNETIKEELGELQKSIDSILKEKKRMLRDIESNYSHNKINYILDKIKMNLINQSEHLAKLATSNPREFESEIVAIIKSTLISEFKVAFEEIHDSIVTDLQESIQTANFNIGDIKETFNNITSSLEKILKIISDNSGLYKILTTILGVLTNVIAPILEIIIIFLPDILSKIFNQDEKVKEKLISEIIPQITMRLRSEITMLFNQEVAKLITQITDEFEEKLQTAKAEIEQTVKEKENQALQINEEIAKLSKQLENLKKTQKELYQIGEE